MDANDSDCRPPSSLFLARIPLICRRYGSKETTPKRSVEIGKGQRMNCCDVRDSIVKDRAPPVDAALKVFSQDGSVFRLCFIRGQWLL